MSWLRLALGLIREAATTEVGQEIINDIASGAAARARGQRPKPDEGIDEWRRFVDERLTVIDRNQEILVQMLNAQVETLIKIQKRQRVWNVALAFGILSALILTIYQLVR